MHASLMTLDDQTKRQAKGLYYDLMRVEGDLLVKPFEFYKDIPKNVIRVFMHDHGIYCLPTLELVDFLKKEIGTGTAVEIGCGNGAMAKLLNIPATDAKQQEDPKIKAFYALIHQPVIKYPKWVEKYEAIEAVKHYNPDVVIGSYITHKYDGESGNINGVEEREILPLVKKLIHIGDGNTHKEKPLMNIRCKVSCPEWLIVRSEYGFIGIWEGGKK